MRTKPPCMLSNGTDCPKRYIGCRAECDEWHKWLIIHAKEKERFMCNKQKDWDCVSFEADLKRRNTNTYSEKSQTKARNSIREVKYD